MTRKRQAGDDLAAIHRSDSDDNADAGDGGTWQRVDDEELAKREIVKVSRKPKSTLNPEAAPFPAFNFGATPAASAPKSPPKGAAPAPKSPPKGARPSPADESNPLLKFLAPAGSWNCSVCLLTNKASDKKCVACDSPAPGSTSPKPAQAAAAGASEFKFGVSPGETTGDVPSFKFGGDGATKPFAFGGGDGGFKFGATGDAAQTFSSLSSSGGATFSFLSAGTKPEGGDSDDQPASSFSFGTVPTAGAGLETTSAAPLAEPVPTGEENDTIVAKIAVAAYTLKEVEKEVDGKTETKQSWLECGSGELHVNKYQDAAGKDAARMVLRMAKTHRLVLNVPVFKGMVYERASVRMVRLSTVGEDNKIEAYLLKSKTKEETDALVKAIEELTA
ncbi:RanBP2-type domain-containing protein [Plasmodiophora brassicae]